MKAIAIATFVRSRSGRTAQFDSAHTIGPVATGILDDVLSLCSQTPTTISPTSPIGTGCARIFRRAEVYGRRHGSRTRVAALVRRRHDERSQPARSAFNQARAITAYFAAPSFVFSGFSTSGNKVNSNYMDIVNRINKDAASSLSFTKVDLGSSDDSFCLSRTASSRPSRWIARTTVPGHRDPGRSERRRRPTTGFTLSISTRSNSPPYFSERDTCSIHPSSLTNMSYVTVDPATGCRDVTDGLQSDGQGDIFQGPVEHCGETPENIRPDDRWDICVRPGDRRSRQSSLRQRHGHLPRRAILADHGHARSDVDRDRPRQRRSRQRHRGCRQLPGIRQRGHADLRPGIRYHRRPDPRPTELERWRQTPPTTRTVLDSVVYGFTPASGDPT